MNKLSVKSINSRKREEITLQYVLRYLAVMIGYAICLAFVAVFGIGICREICRQFTWYPDDPFYLFLKVIDLNTGLFAGIALVVGWVAITCYHMGKPLRYMNEIIEASEQLVSLSEQPIELSAPIKSVQDELNLVREQALRNAMIAREAEQRKNDLIVFLAHDLKTPLTSVIGYLTLLRDEPQISEELAKKYRGIALDKALRLEELLNEFFDITRFNYTTLNLETERRNLSRMLEQLAFEFRPLLLEKNLSIRADITPDVEIVCDMDKMERVFDNLIRNAMNYSYENTEIVLTMRRLKEEVEICIINRGKTIPQAKLNRIFEQFFRLDASRSSASGGVGLGLAIAKQITELHGGSIQAESENESIIFIVKLPLEPCGS